MHPRANRVRFVRIARQRVGAFMAPRPGAHDPPFSENARRRPASAAASPRFFDRVGQLDLIGSRHLIGMKTLRFCESFYASRERRASVRETERCPPEAHLAWDVH